MIPRLPKGFSHPMRVGEGAFASVYRARQSALDRWVAVKILNERDRGRRQELLREARTQASIKAECIPQVYDAFEWRRAVCIVMQWINGLPLSRLLEQDLSKGDRRMIAHGVILALAGLHASGFAHRDLKPENVVISADGIFLVDFGFTKMVSDGQRSVACVAKGTPAYMAPELWKRGGDVDLMRADVYSLGRILLQVLGDDDAGEQLKCLLEENPDSRPGSAGEVLRIWEAATGGCGFTPRWERLVGTRTAQVLSRDLYTAAKQLLFAGRSDEAYWLLVESIEEDPDNADAVALMGDFGHHARSRRLRRSVPVAAAAAVSVGLSLLAFAAGWGSREYPVAVEREQRRSEFIRRIGNPGPLSAVTPFREDSLRGGALTGTLVITDHHGSEGRLVLDGNSVDPSNDPRRGIEVGYGEHVVTLFDGAERVVWRERFKILPFQVRIVSLHAENRGDR